MLVLAGFSLLRTHPARRSTFRGVILFLVATAVWSAIGVAVAGSAGNGPLVLILASYFTACTVLAVWSWRVLRRVDEIVSVNEAEERSSNGEQAVQAGRALAKAVRRWAS
jgi:hypothetical protein